jgi:predicted RND superfamily exporter protein
MILPIVTALLAVVWSLGVMGWLRLPLDPFNTTTPVLILAVAAGHAVQILKRYYEEYDRTPDVRTAVRRALVTVGPVMLTAGTIAALSFLSLTAFPTATMRNFGLLSGVGILAALVVELTLIPAVRVLLPPPRAVELTAEARGGRYLDGALDRLTARVAARPGAVVVVAAAVLVVAAVAATRVRVDTTFKRQFASDHPISADDAVLNEAFAGTNTLVFVIEGETDDALHDPQAIAAIARLQHFVEQDAAVGKTFSVVDLLRAMHRALHGGSVQGDGLPDSADLVSQYLFLYGTSGQPEDLDSQIDPQHRSAVVRVYLHQDSTGYGEALLTRVRAFVAEDLPPGLSVRYSGTLASNAALTEVMVHGKVLNMLQIAAIILTISALVFRSIAAGILVATPLAAAVLVNFGFMGMLGIPLDVITAPIAAMAVGIGSDYAIYFLYRLREERAAGTEPATALARTMRTSGKAIVYVSSAIAGGYLVLATSGFVFHIELGVLVALAMVVSSAAAITLLPALVLLTTPRFLEAASQPATPPLARRAAV